MTTSTQNQTIAQVLGIEDLPFEMQDSIIDQAGELIFQAVMVRSADTLPPEDQEALEKLLDDERPFAEVIGFLEKRVPNFMSIVSEEGSKIKNALQEN